MVGYNHTVDSNLHSSIMGRLSKTEAFQKIPYQGNWHSGHTESRPMYMYINGTIFNLLQARLID